MEPETYQQTLDYLYSFVDYSLTRGLRNLPEKFDLNRMREFMKFLGHPEKQYPIIHVAGTKGKGSVCALCASALRSAGYKVGLYTSPHLQDYAERIQVDGIPIPHQDLVDLVQEIKPFLDQSKQITTFEITTALAFLYFASQQTTAVVAEVGLGGRLDATNVVDPLVTVISSISYDHTQVLGNTLAEIAGEKAGIIKPGIPVVIAPQKDEARLVFERIAQERRAPLIQVGRDYLFTSPGSTLECQALEVWRSDAGLENSVRLEIPLLGAHQLENAATAYASLQIARESGLEIEVESIQDGFASTTWPGRFEILRRDPPVVVDAAHNRDSARRLNDAIDAYFPDLPMILVFGASEDKDIEGMLTELSGRVDEIIFTRSYHPRAIEPADLLILAEKFGKPVRVIPAVEKALESALESAGSRKQVLVTGSIFIAAGARQYWYNRIAA